MEDSIYCTRTITSENVTTASEIRTCYFNPWFKSVEVLAFQPLLRMTRRLNICEHCEAWVWGDWLSDHWRGAPCVPRCRISHAPPPCGGGGRDRTKPNLTPSWSSQGQKWSDTWVLGCICMELTDIRKHLLWLQHLHYMYMYLYAIHNFNRLA